MKITIVDKKYEDVIAMPKDRRIKPQKQWTFLRFLMKSLAYFDLRATNFKYKRINMELLGENEPCLVLMNHSSFIDLEIVATILHNRSFNIVTTSDAFAGIMKRIMYLIGCIPTKKFVSDANLIRDMLYCIKQLKSTVVMYPEASYSFDGTATPLPDSVGRCVKILGVPVVMIRTYGAFTRQPLYNSLRKRKVDVSADVKYLISPQQVSELDADRINEIINREFAFDNFAWQQENEIDVRDKERAEGLNRVLYKCPHCLTEGQMEGQGTVIRCGHCGVQYELTERGFLRAIDGEGRFQHIPDWYRWERDCVRRELEDHTYDMEVPVDICMMVNMKSIYRVGEGVLKHSEKGFYLTGCDGKLEYCQKPTASYSLYADYYWYEIADVICIGDVNVLYYCFPKNGKDIVAKTRLATEELYKIARRSLKKAARKGI